MKIEDKKKVTIKVIRFFFIILFITFLTLYISSYAGYGEYQSHKQVVLTKEQIKKFEEDVKNNKNISIEEYYEVSMKDYNNKTSRLGLKISEKMGNYARSGIEAVFDILNKLVDD